MTMFQRTFGYSIEKTEEEILYSILCLPDDDYVNHNLILEALEELKHRKFPETT